MGKECDIGYILSLGVHKKYRRNGIGSLLLDALISYLTTLEKTKVKAIFLHVLTTNQPAILFYEKRRYIIHFRFECQQSEQQCFNRNILLNFFFSQVSNASIFAILLFNKRLLQRWFHICIVHKRRPSAMDIDRYTNHPI